MPPDTFRGGGLRAPARVFEGQPAFPTEGGDFRRYFRRDRLMRLGRELAMQGWLQQYGFRLPEQ
jgi:hypothetical protein